MDDPVFMEPSNSEGDVSGHTASLDVGERVEVGFLVWLVGEEGGKRKGRGKERRVKEGKREGEVGKRGGEERGRKEVKKGKGRGFGGKRRKGRRREGEGEGEGRTVCKILNKSPRGIYSITMVKDSWSKEYP
jgi:hypothetical protein